MTDPVAAIRPRGPVAVSDATDSEPLNGRVYARLRAQLMSGVFEPGQVVSIRGLAERLGTSTMPVREALHRLIADNALEARANRTIVVPVVTRVGAIPDVVSEGRHGLFVPVADAPALAEAIGALAADPASLACMRAACRARVASAFSIGRVADDLRALYSTLLKHHVRNRRLGRSPT